MLITGGSLYPISMEKGVWPRDKWQLWCTEEGLDDSDLEAPTGSECADSLLFAVDLNRPSNSTVDVLPSPNQDRRVYHQLIPIGDLGVLSLGGEVPATGLGSDTLANGELFLESPPGVSPFTVFLTTGRSRFAAATLPIDDGGLDLYLFGGTPTPGEEERLTDIEVLRLGE